MIISASRRCDLPAIYPKWLTKRFEEQYVLVRNPYSYHDVSRVDLSPSSVDAIVFWTKNPRPFIPCLSAFDRYAYCFQYTLTGYPASIEPGVPPLEERIESFRDLSLLCGPVRVVWRYDPILMTDDLSVGYHKRMFAKLCTALEGYADVCMISFFDMYRHLERVRKRLGIREPTVGECLDLAQSFSDIAKRRGFSVRTCAESADLSRFGIEHGACIDSGLLARISGKIFQRKKDTCQRNCCGCLPSVDIGTYGTCPYNCSYCYANARTVTKIHDVDSPLQIGRLDDRDIVHMRKNMSMTVSYQFPELPQR